MDTFSRRVARTAAVFAVGAVTGALLIRLAAVTRPVPMLSSSAPPRTTAAPVPSLPAHFPVVSEADAPPASWLTAVHSGNAPSSAWKVAFERYDRARQRTDIWTGNGDGSGVKRILTDAEWPCWSPHRRLLAFARGGNVWVARPDGTNARPITFWQPNEHHVGAREWPVEIQGVSWNAKDNVLSFARDEVWYLRAVAGDAAPVRVSGSTLHHLSLSGASDPTTPRTPYADAVSTESFRRLPPRFDLADDRARFHWADNAYPSWTRDADRMAFVRNGDIWVAERSVDIRGESTGTPGATEGWSVGRAVACAAYDGATGHGSHWGAAAFVTSWAPDGSFLAFGVRRIGGSGYADLYVARPPRQVGSVSYTDVSLSIDGFDPCVSPDGGWILYHGYAPGKGSSERGLYAVTPDGKRFRRILEDEDAGRAVW